MVGMQGLFAHLDLITNGVSILFHQQQLSPLLVDRNQMIKEVRALEVEQGEMKNMLMIAPSESTELRGYPRSTDSCDVACSNRENFLIPKTVQVHTNPNGVLGEWDVLLGESG